MTSFEPEIPPSLFSPSLKMDVQALLRHVEKRNRWVHMQRQNIEYNVVIYFDRDHTEVFEASTALSAAHAEFMEKHKNRLLPAQEKFIEVCIAYPARPSYR